VHHLAEIFHVLAQSRVVLLPALELGELALGADLPRSAGSRARRARCARPAAPSPSVVHSVRRVVRVDARGRSRRPRGAHRGTRTGSRLRGRSTPRRGLTRRVSGSCATGPPRAPPLENRCGSYQRPSSGLFSPLRTASRAHAYASSSTAALPSRAPARASQGELPSRRPSASTASPGPASPGPASPGRARASPGSSPSPPRTASRARAGPPRRRAVLREHAHSAPARLREDTADQRTTEVPFPRRRGDGKVHDLAPSSTGLFKQNCSFVKLRSGMLSFG